jgi:hypothetical protein
VVAENSLERHPIFDRLNAQLSGASELLAEAARNVKSTEMDHKKNIGRIAEALKNITEVLDDLYELEPELVPLFLRDTKRWKKHFEGR